MKSRIFLATQLLVVLNLVAQNKNAYLGEKLPGMDPKVFAADFLPKGPYLHTVSFTPDGKECYLTVESRDYNGGTIMVSKLENDKWSKPVPAPIPGEYREIDPLLIPDGSAMLFCTNRPVNEGDEVTGNMDIWMMKRNRKKWGAPEYLGEEVNTKGQDWFPTLTNSGKLYYSPWIGDVSNIHTSEMKDGVYQKGKKLGDNVNSSNLDYDPLIAPDESFLIFCSNRPNGYGDVDLYVCFKNADGSWTKAKNMGNKINSMGAEFAPTITPDGKYFFFARDKEIFWVKAEVIEKLR